MFAKTLLLMMAVAFAGVSPGSQAQAEVSRPKAYESLTAVELAPGKLPRAANGLSDLSQREKRHGEKLPMQLDGAIKRIKKKKYAPAGVARDRPIGF